MGTRRVKQNYEVIILSATVAELRAELREVERQRDSLVEILNVKTDAEYDELLRHTCCERMTEH
jgi:hypothetical protein